VTARRRSLCQAAGKRECVYGRCYWQDSDGTAWVVEVDDNGIAWTLHDPSLTWNEMTKRKATA